VAWMMRLDLAINEEGGYLRSKCQILWVVKQEYISYGKRQS
jgi:hypothetical protein